MWRALQQSNAVGIARRCPPRPRKSNGNLPVDPRFQGEFDKYGLTTPDEKRAAILCRRLSYEPNDAFLRHQYGVALSRVGREEDAISEFTAIVDDESKRVPPRETLIMSSTTRIINLKRLGRTEEARQDLRTARELLERHPHLSHSTMRLDELEAEIKT